ncbi:MAG: T9SS type A sorting domain-containing protein [Bacteroidota bacterium]
MKKQVLLLLSTMLLTSIGFAQIYVDEFDNDDPANMGGSGSYSFTEENSELTINATNTGPWDVFTYQPHDQATGEAMLIDMTETNKIFVRVKASNVGTQLRMDVEDADGFSTSLAGITKTMTTEFNVLEFDFSGTYQDGGFGGTSCTMDTAPCTVDGTRIKQLVFYTDPGAGGFNGSVVMDYIAVGTEVAAEAMSDVFQDHFDQADSTLGAFDTILPQMGYFLSTTGSELVIKGDGTTQMWDAIGYDIRNQNTFESIDIDVSGNNKMFIKVKSTVPGTALRIDVQDIDGFVSTAGSITKIIGTEYEVIEYDYSGTYQDLGFGGTPCTESTAPCNLDPTRINSLVMFIEPGVGGYVGELTIDYISFGNSLEPPGDEPLLLYGDHFSNEALDFTNSDAFDVAESASNLVITGDGTAGPFNTVSYVLHDKETQEEITVDLGPAKNKVIINAKTNGANVPLRIDIVDADNFQSTLTSVTKIITGESTIYEYDFSSSQDGGYGGTACETGPCLVNTGAVKQLLLYPDPIAGGFEGEITLDFLSIGQPLGEEEVDLGPAGIANYSDQFNENTVLFLSDVTGLTSMVGEEALSIMGDGSSGPWTPVSYGIHNEEGNLILADAAAGGNKVFVRAKSSTDGTTLRVDLQDNMDFVTNANAVSTTLTMEYVVYELDYANALNDGGFGGSPCTMETAPCPVDPKRIANVQFFIEPGVGMFDGTVDIDWISFGKSLEDVVAIPAGIVNYSDELDASTVDQITDVEGLVTSITENTWTITGGGSSGMWTPVSYAIHNEEGTGILADAVGSGDKVYVRARSSVAGTILRMDLQDNEGFVTNANAQANTLTEAYVVYEYNYANAYADGGFGGTPCTMATAPCPVDGERIGQLQFFINPGVGMFEGTVDIDWISFGAPLSTSIVDVEKLATLKAYPNPTNGLVTLEYDLLTTSTVQLKVFDIFGKQLNNQHLGLQTTGQQQQIINLDTYANGIYLLQLEADGYILGAMRLMKN